jgi:DNA-binding winged helix-turn-helix (wHTH) protein
MPLTTHRFGAFELDKGCRALRLEGRELALQPRVFDLLCYLVDNRDRVVSKEELLDALWPGVVVTEGSLQRAVSLARTALQQGGLGEALRNYARRGYRFMHEDRAELTQKSAADACFEDAQWRDAMQRYAEADRVAALDAESLERWATAAQCAGDLQGAVLPLERAAAAYASRSEQEAAARVTIALARAHIESLNAAVAQGCLRRAQRLIDGLPRGAQHGQLAAMNARLYLYQGDLAAATAEALEACAIGRELKNTDIEAMGLLYWGIALQASGDTARGLAMQDEAAAAVMAGNVSPLLGGIVYCGIISSCCNCGDWQRAEQWTESFTRWCQRGRIDTFAGACLVHQAEVFAMSGKLPEARDLILRADPIIRVDAPWALGDAHRLLGDVHLACGDADAAERCYRDAYQQGWDPYPGYALLLHQLGRTDEAIVGLKRAATLTSWNAAERRARYLAYAAQLAALVGRLDEARVLLATLEAEPKSWECGAVAGQVFRARAELAWAAGESDAAIAMLHSAIETLKQYRAVMDVALARMRLAECLTARGERGAAELELLAAESAFEAAGATGYRDRCRHARHHPAVR